MNEANLSIKPPSQIYGLRESTIQDCEILTTKPFIYIRFDGQLVRSINRKINWIHPFERVT